MFLFSTALQSQFLQPYQLCFFGRVVWSAFWSVVLQSQFPKSYQLHLSLEKKKKKKKKQKKTFIIGQAHNEKSFACASQTRSFGPIILVLSPTKSKGHGGISQMKPELEINHSAKESRDVSEDRQVLQR